eukprot:ANDGO_07053.mRNA.1 Protein kri1
MQKGGEKKSLDRQFQDRRRVDEVAAQSEDDSETSDTSESEDSDAELLTPDIEATVLETLQKIRSKDPEIYDSSKVFFSKKQQQQQQQHDVSASGVGENGSKSSKKGKSMFLKDYLRKELLAGRVDDGSIVDDSKLDMKKNSQRTYVEEQADAKREFLEIAKAQLADAAGTESEDDQFLKPRRKSAKRGEENENEEEEQDEDQGIDVEKLAAAAPKLGGKLGKSKAIEYFTGQDLSEDERFLRDYILNQRWVDRDKHRVPTYDEIVAEEAEEAFDEKADEFESKYNFRFEQDGGDQIVSYPRVIEDSLRVDARKEKRKEERKRKLERKEQEKIQIQEELKRSKSMKRQEIEKRMEMIKKIGGFSKAEMDRLAKIDIEADFDPSQYDEQMAAAFDDGYYAIEEGEDVVENVGLDAEGGDDPSLKKLFASQTAKKGKPDEGAELLQEEGEEMAGDVEDSWNEDVGAGLQEDAGDEDIGVAAAKEGPTVGRHSKIPIKKFVDELDKMDYEDIIAGGLKTRFKYREVAPRSYGMNLHEILDLDDRQLNKHVSLKRIAPYREDEEDMTEGMYRNKKRKLNPVLEEERRKLFKKELEKTGRKMQSKAQDMGISAETLGSYVASSSVTKQSLEAERADKELRRRQKKEKDSRKREQKESASASKHQ